MLFGANPNRHPNQSVNPEIDADPPWTRKYVGASPITLTISKVFFRENRYNKPFQLHKMNHVTQRCDANLCDLAYNVTFCYPGKLLFTMYSFLKMVAKEGIAPTTSGL